MHNLGQISNELLELVHNYSPDNVTLTTSRVMEPSGSNVADGGKKKKRRGIGKNKRSKNIETDPLLQKLEENSFPPITSTGTSVNSL